MKKIIILFFFFIAYSLFFSNHEIYAAQNQCTFYQDKNGPFITYLYNYPGIIGIGGKFTNQPLTVEFFSSNNTRLTQSIISNPQKFYRNTQSPTYEYTDDDLSSDTDRLLIFEKPELSINKINSVKISQQDRHIEINLPTLSGCTTANEPFPEISVWLELRKDNPSGNGEVSDLEDLNWDLIKSSKFKNDMQKLYDSGVHTLVINPQLNMWSSCAQTLLPRYNLLTSTINNSLAQGSFNFIVQPNYFPEVNYSTGEYIPKILPAWDFINNTWVSTPKNDKDAYKDLYSCLSEHLKNTPNFSGIMPWQEATSRHYKTDLQNELINSQKSALSGSATKVYGFDGWIENNSTTDHMETKYLNKNFGDILVHQTYPGNNLPFLNGSPGIQGTADGIKFLIRGLSKLNSPTPINIQAYLQAFDKGKVSCPGIGTPSPLSWANFDSRWNMINEFDAQRAAINFYSDKYNTPTTLSGAMFYYYGNYYNNSGKDHIWSNEETANKPTLCWPRIDNSPDIFNEVLSTTQYIIQPTPKTTSFQTPTPTPKGTYSPRDIDRNGKVDIFDYNILFSDFGKTGTPGFVASDINRDGKVNMVDYTILVRNFGK